MTQEIELPTKDELEQLSSLMEQWEWLKLNEQVLQEAVKKNAADIERLECEAIPGLMAAAGNIEKFKLSDGRSVSLKDELYANISEANRASAFAWLESHNLGDVIKDTLTVQLGKGKQADQRSKSLMEYLDGLGVTTYQRKRAVAPNTLQALLREQIEEGRDVPKETFSVFQRKRAVIKKA